MRKQLNLEAMVNNSIYKCDYCGSLLRLRYQVGYLNIPISIYCPKCNSHIAGIVVVDNENISLSDYVIGATKHKGKDYDYVIELSTEFLVDKNKAKKDFPKYPLSMFFRSNPFDEERNKRREALLNFVNSSDYYINVIENLYNLLEGNKIDLIREFFLSNDVLPFLRETRDAIDYNQIINDLDAMLATKHLFNNILNPIMPKGVFDNIYDIMNVKTRNLVRLHFESVKEFLKNLEDDYFQTYLHRIPKFIVDYIKHVEQLIPIYDIYDSFDSVDLKERSISTLSIDDMAVIYKKGYELLCDSIDLLIGLSNIETNGSYDNFGKGILDFNKKLNSYNSKFAKFEEFTKRKSCLFDGIRGTLNSIIRNAEGHNSIVIDGLEQTITFINKHKGIISKHKASFLEFGKMCVDLFVAILYVWEYYYQFVKFKAVLIEKKPLHYGK